MLGLYLKVLRSELVDFLMVVGSCSLSNIDLH